ncbi:MAG TPA: sigma factor-like helix-turn-helix DNA-binding protein [Solirubrobacterales bacterium]
MYGTKVRDELSQAKLDEARRGFIQLLRKRFSPQFIANHGEELFAKAALEYSRKINEGAEIETPVGWLINCAWRRTGGLLEAQGRTPDMVSAELAAGLTDERGQSPEQVALETDRFDKVHKAVDQLSREERQLLELSYFEGMAVREAARELHWHPSKAQRCHEAARRRLQELLGVSSSDDLQIEIGLAAYVSLAAEASTGGRITGLLQRAGQKSAEGLASLKQQAAATYSRAVDPTPLAGARPGTVAALLVSCVTIGGGAATYCAQHSVDPLSAASGLISGEDESKAAESNPPSETTAVAPLEPQPTTTEETVSEPSPSPEAQPQPQAKQEPEPKPEPEPTPPPEQSFEPASPDYPATEAASESVAPETSSPERARPAPVSGGAPQFGGP